MKRNKFLPLSLYFFRIVQLLLLVCGLIISLLFVYYLFDNESFKNVVVSEESLVYSGSINDTTEKSVSMTTMYWKDINPLSQFFIIFQFITCITLGGLVIQEFIKVIKSLQLFQTFRSRNVESFRKMALYFLIIFILSSFSFLAVGKKGNFEFDLDLKFMMLAIASYILAEIFKEGNRLYEEEQLTV